MTVSPYRVVLAGIAPDANFSHILSIGCLKSYADRRPRLRGQVEILLKEYVRGQCGSAAREIAEAQPALVGFSCYIWNIEEVLRMAGAVKASLPGVRIVLGGPEASARAAELLARGGLDYVVRGEGEDTFSELLERLAEGADPAGLKGLASRGTAGILVNPSRPLIKDIDSIPCPYQGGALRVAPGYSAGVVIETMRGCPFECAFCAWGDKGGVRYFPVERILETMRQLLAASPALTFFIADSDMFLHRARAKKLLRGFRKLGEGRNASWWFATNVRHFDPELMRLANWENFSFGVGVESTNPKALKTAGRAHDIGRLTRNVRLFKRLSPKARISFQLLCGLPGDDLKGYRQSLDWALSIGVDECNTFQLQILPGTRFREEGARFAIEYDPRPPYDVRSTASFPASDIRAARLLAYKTGFFMSNPGIRRALDPVWSAGEGCTVLCEELSARLESGGIHSLEQDFARCEKDAPETLNPIGARWPGTATHEQQLAILRSVRSCLKERLPADLRSKADRLLIEEEAWISWRQLWATPAFDRMLSRLRPTGPGESRLLVCREGSPEVDRLGGPGGSVILLTQKPVEMERDDRPRAVGVVHLEKPSSASHLVREISGLPGGYDETILSNGFLRFSAPWRVRLLEALAGKIRAGGRLLLMDASQSAPVDPQSLVAELSDSTLKVLDGPHLLRRQGGSSGGGDGQWVFLVARKAGRHG